MIFPRIIPVLLLKNNGLYKTLKFKNPKYVGDPLNAVKVFNEKEVDELILIDFTATIENKSPSYGLIEDIASQCFMPLCYGGGINSIDSIKQLVQSGVEKIALNSKAADDPSFVEKAANLFGSSTIVISIDVKKNLLGKYEVYSHSGSKKVKLRPEEYAKHMEERGAGEILLNSISNDGTMLGYDLELIKSVSSSVRIPVITCGGAGEINHFKDAYDSGASAMAAGSLFVFHGKHRGVLISYPAQEDLNKLFTGKNV
jgi:imidazole glycerol-phosphate synthase subunit HisF